DKPGSPQSVIRAALVAPPRAQGDEVARDALNTVLGGSFTSRLNMKLREERGWAYGARSSIGGGLGAQTFIVNASVQADRTAESMVEIAGLLEGIAGDAPVSEDELAAARNDLGLGLTSAWATSRGIAGYLIDQQAFGLPDDHYARYPAEVAGIALDAVRDEAEGLLAGRALTWVVVGDRSRIEAAIRSLGLGEVRVIDADGMPADQAGRLPQSGPLRQIPSITAPATSASVPAARFCAMALASRPTATTVAATGTSTPPGRRSACSRSR